MPRDAGGAGGGEGAGEFLRILYAINSPGCGCGDRGEVGGREQARGAVQEKQMNSPSIDRRMVLMAFAAMFGLIACQAPNSARGVVDRFIAAHYMAIDLKAAEPLCTGLA